MQPIERRGGGVHRDREVGGAIVAVEVAAERSLLGDPSKPVGGWRRGWFQVLPLRRVDVPVARTPTIMTGSDVKGWLLCDLIHELVKA